MLSLAQSLVKTSNNDKPQILRPLTVVYWSDFMNNPSVMYGLFAPTMNKLNYDPDRVKVMGTREGMINQINVSRVEDLDSICEELLGMPLLIRVWAEHVQQTQADDDTAQWEGDLALLVDTSHPMIRPDLERNLEEARKLLQAHRKFCVEIDFGPAIEKWLEVMYPRTACTVGSFKHHKARLFITNHAKPEHCFDCSCLWYTFFWSCWLFSAPCYKCYRSCKCTDIKFVPQTTLVRRSLLPNGKVIEISRLNMQAVVDDLGQPTW